MEIPSSEAAHGHPLPALETGEDHELERRRRWEAVVAARQANPHAIVDYRTHKP